MGKDVHETARDTYHRRRTVETGELTEAVIEDLRVADDGMQNTVQVVFRVAGDTYVTETTYEEPDDITSEMQELLLEIAGQPPYDAEELGYETVELAFNEAFDSCGLESGSYPLSVTLVEDTRLVGSSVTLDDIIGLLLLSHYEAQEPRDDGWTLPITGVSTHDDDTFIVKVATGVGRVLTWEFDVPQTTDPEGSEVAALVENVGGGDIKHLTGEPVYVVHTDDTNRRLETVGVDETGRWALVTPSAFKRWQAAEQKKRRVSSSSSSSTAVKNSELLDTCRDGMIYGLGLPVQILVMKYVMEVLGIQQQLMTEAPELYEMVMNLLNIMMLFGFVAGVVSMALYVYLSSTQT